MHLEEIKTAREGGRNPYITRRSYNRKSRDFWKLICARACVCLGGIFPFFKNNIYTPSPIVYGLFAELYNTHIYVYRITLYYAMLSIIRVAVAMVFEECILNSLEDRWIEGRKRRERRRSRGRGTSSKHCFTSL
jgi:hypothetical protein